MSIAQPVILGCFWRLDRSAGTPCWLPPDQGGWTGAAGAASLCHPSHHPASMMASCTAIPTISDYLSFRSSKMGTVENFHLNELSKFLQQTLRQPIDLPAITRELANVHNARPWLLNMPPPVPGVGSHRQDDCQHRHYHQAAPPQHTNSLNPSSACYFISARELFHMQEGSEHFSNAADLTWPWG